MDNFDFFEERLKRQLLPQNFERILHTRHPLVDAPYCIDKITLSTRLNRLNLKKTLPWLKGKPWINLKQTKRNFRIFIHAELIAQFHNPGRFIRALVYKMWQDGLFWTLPKDEPYLSVIDPSDYLFTFVTISEIEFAFDFLEVQIPQELFHREYSLYSDPIFLSSGALFKIFCAYNRKKRLIQKNQNSHQEINALRYCYRAEFRVKSSFCHFLNVQNLDGFTPAVFSRFFGVLSQLAHYNVPPEFRVLDYFDEGHILAQMLFEYVWAAERHRVLISTEEWHRNIKKTLLMARDFR